MNFPAEKCGFGGHVAGTTAEFSSESWGFSGVARGIALQPPGSTPKGPCRTCRPSTARGVAREAACEKGVALSPFALSREEHLPKKNSLHKQFAQTLLPLFCLFYREKGDNLYKLSRSCLGRFCFYWMQPFCLQLEASCLQWSFFTHS